MRSIYTTALILGVTLTGGACESLDSVGPDPEADPVLVTPHELRHGPIQVALEVAPAELDPPGTVTARLTYTNLGLATVEVVSGYGCLSFASVYRAGERIPFPTTEYGCTAAVTKRDLAPGASLTREWPLAVGDGDGAGAPSGTYRFVAHLNTHAFDLERTFVVR